ncbi:MAG: glycosyltransferase family 9 protein [Verrucomicrobiales bacterium]|nr:glycosyltransferase family 9 protein [Verrucomicrobiales bacterium]
MGKILIIRGGALGDFILTLPSIQLIRDTLPDAQIEILGYPNVATLAESAGLADASRSIEYGPLSLFFVPGASLPDDLVDYFQSFAVVISYLYDPDGYFESNVRKAGVDTYLRGPYRIDESTSPAVPASVQLARPLEQLALFLENPAVTLSLPADESHTKTNRRTIAIHPGSGSPSKNWSFEAWIDIVSRIQEASAEPLHFLIVSGEAETGIIDQFLEMFSGTGLSHFHLQNATLPDLATHLSRADLFLGHDTGVSHLAAACDIPCVLLFGPTNPAVWAPQNSNVEVIQSESGSLAGVNSDTVLERVRELVHTLK